MNLNEFKSQFAKSMYGITKEEAQEQNICISCKQPIYVTSSPENKQGNIYTNKGIKEYQISGLCEYCFDEAFK